MPHSAAAATLSRRGEDAKEQRRRRPARLTALPPPRCARPAGPAQGFIRRAGPAPLPSLPPPGPARPAAALISAGLPLPLTSREAGGHARGSAPPSSPQSSQRPHRPWEAGRERPGVAAAPFWGAAFCWDPARCPPYTAGKQPLSVR